jgi:hypothetical protein
VAHIGTVTEVLDLTVVNRWDEKAGLRTGCGVRSQVIDVLEAQIKRRPATKKVSTVAVQESRNFSQPKLTIGLDLGDRSSWYCVLDEAGTIVLEQKLGTTPKAMKEAFGAVPRSRIALETGMHSPWVSRLLSELGHEVIVARCAQCAVDRGESKERRSAGCADVGSIGQDRSPVVVSGAASQRESAGGSDRNPGAGRVGAGRNGAGEHGTRTGQELRGAVARV